MRIFETNEPGATFAVTVWRGEQEELLWRGRPALATGGARVLELEVQPPQRLERVRVYLRNDLSPRWTEIDTICLVATEPVPERLRKKPSPARRRWSIGCSLLTLLAIASCSIWIAIPKDPRPMPERPTEALAGSNMMVWQTSKEVMLSWGVVWASSVSAYSSQFQSADNSAAKALFEPDVYPNYGDDVNAWAPDRADLGPEWITVAFPRATNASAVVIVETSVPGSLVRIDDVSGPAPVVLFEGTTQVFESSRVLSLELPEPRLIRAIRVVLDTRRASGWNEIDAIGLHPAQIAP